MTNIHGKWFQLELKNIRKNSAEMAQSFDFSQIWL